MKTSITFALDVGLALRIKKLVEQGQYKSTSAFLQQVVAEHFKEKNQKTISSSTTEEPKDTDTFF